MSVQQENCHSRFGGRFLLKLFVCLFSGHGQGEEIGSTRFFAEELLLLSFLLLEAIGATQLSLELANVGAGMEGFRG